MISFFLFYRELHDLSGSGPALQESENKESYFNISSVKKHYKQLASKYPLAIVSFKYLKDVDIKHVLQ